MMPVMLGLLFGWQTALSQAVCHADNLALPAGLSVGETVVTVGLEDTSPLFRVAGAVFLSANGGLIVANTGTNELIAFDQSGRFRWRFGGSGAGPGEFRSLGPIVLTNAGSLAATDIVGGKVVEVSPDGDLLSTHTFTGQKVSKVMPASGGRWLVYGTSEPRPLATGGRLRGVGLVTLHAPDGRLEAQVLEVPGIELFDFRPPTGGYMRGFPPFAVATRVSADRAGCLWVATGDEPVVTGYGVDGREIGRIEIPYEPPPVSEAEWDQRIDAMAERAGSPSRITELRGILRQVEFDSRRPSVGGLLVDDGGWIWVARFHHPDLTVDGWWVAPGLDGEIAWVAAPAGTKRLLAVSRTHVALLTVDALGVETIALRRIRFR